MHPPWTISPQGLCHAAKTSLDFLLCCCHNSYGSQRALSLFWGYCWNNSFCPSSRENSFVTVRITHYTQPEVRVSHNKVLNFLVFAVSCQDGNQISTDLHQHYLSYTTVPTHTSRFICSHKINNYPKVWNNSVVTDKNANLPEPSVFICWQFISWRNNIY